MRNTRLRKQGSVPHDDNGLARAPVRAITAFECFPALLERKRPGDFHAQVPTGDKPRELDQLLSVGRDEEKLGDDSVFIGLAIRRGPRNGDQSSPGPQHPKRAIQCVTADGIDHHVVVGTAFVERFCAHVDHSLRAEPTK